MESNSRESVADDVSPTPSWMLRSDQALPPAQRAGCAFLLFLVLLPSLFFPLGADSALFFVSGEKLLEGAVYYRDIVDLKPPLIYYFYAAAIALFGDGAIAIRILDLPLQLATCWMIALLVRRASGNEVWGAISALLYAFHYVSLSSNATALPESYLGLLGIPMILLIDRPGAVRAFSAGILGGTLFLLKFPLGIMIPIAGMVILVNPPTPDYPRWKQLAWLFAGAAATAALLPLYLIVFDVTHDFLLVNSFTSGYMAVSQSSIVQILRDLIESLTSYFGEYFSMTMTILVAAGMIAGLRRRTALSPGGLRLVHIATIAFLLLVLSVLVEGKYTPYRFARIYPFTAILAGLGVMGLVHLLGQKSVQWKYRLLVVVGLTAFALLLSPLPRYIKHSWGGILLATRGSAAFDRLYGSAGSLLYTRQELESIALTIDSNERQGDRLFVVSSVAGQVYHYADQLPPFKIYHSAFLIPTFAPREWKDSTAAFVLRETPRFIVIQRNDSMPTLTGSSVSGEEAFRSIAGVDSLLRTHYSRILQTAWFDLYMGHSKMHGDVRSGDSSSGRRGEQ